MGHTAVLRGPSGSGKSFVGHQLLDHFPPLEELTEPGKTKPRLVGYRLPGDLYVLGPYRAPGGGLDIYSPSDRSRHFDLIRRYAAVGHVFGEALVLSTMIPKLFELGEQLGAENVSFPTMDTPVEKCIQQIYQRNGGRQIKEEAVRGHSRSVASGTRRLVEAGYDTPIIDHTRSFEQVRDLLMSHGWRP